MFGKEFSKDGISVKFHELTTGPEQTQALAAGELDFLHALGGTSAIIAASNGVDLKITNIYSRSPKGFMLISKSADIKEPKDLVGKSSWTKRNYTSSASFNLPWKRKFES